MGAEAFTTVADGANAQEAFTRARDDAAWESGHGGYTGTIAEKHGFNVIAPEPLTDADASALAEKLIEEGDERIDDKWGPAGAIRLAAEEGQRWLFFGWASS